MLFVTETRLFPLYRDVWRRMWSQTSPFTAVSYTHLETGSGKSILLLAMLRLLSGDAQVTGDVLYRGESLFRMPQKRLDEVRGGLISYIPQGSGNGMNPLLKVGFQVGEPLMAHCGLKRRDAQRRSVDLLRRFHLQREEDVYKRQVS